MNIHELISQTSIKVPLEATDKFAAIDELVDLLGASGQVMDVDRLKSVVREREQLRSTGIGEGLAIPHGKCDCIDRLRMAIGIAKEPIEFESIDRKPVRMIVLLASPSDKTSDHIQALGKISRLMNRPEFREAAYSARSAEELYELFEQAEAAMQAAAT